MSVKLMSAVFEAGFEPVPVNVKGRVINVPPSTLKILMLALADSASDTGESIYPSQKTMMRKTGLSHGTLNIAIKAAKQLGLIIPVGQKKSGVIEYHISVQSLGGVRPSDTPPSDHRTPPVRPSDTPRPTIGHDPSSKPSMKRQKRERLPLPNFSDPDLFMQNLKIPEIALYCEITSSTPGIVQMPVIYKAMCGRNYTYDYLMPFWEAWVAKGYRPGDMTWLVEWAADGEIPKHARMNGNGRLSSVDTEAEAKRKAERAREVIRQARESQGEDES